uniref:Uncharacterized protein n=1 Tax=Anguilla anguilla TaxID=7936 RepID=A0A0E9SXY3_ANGAN
MNTQIHILKCGTVFRTQGESNPIIKNEGESVSIILYWI